jgi:signal transduction histidine kinase
MSMLLTSLASAVLASCVWLAVWRRAARDLAHEVRRPMTAMVLAGEGMRFHLPAGEFEALTCQLKAASSLLDRSDPLSRILARGFARPEGSSVPLRYAVSSVVGAWRPAARSEGRRIRLRHQLPDRAFCDAGAFNGALSNLLANALEHGSGDVTVSSVPSPDGGWAVEVANQGRSAVWAGGAEKTSRPRGRGERIARAEVRRMGGELVRWTPDSTVARLEFGKWQGTS